MEFKMVDAVSIVAPTLREAVNIPVLASRVHGALSRRESMHLRDVCEPVDQVIVTTNRRLT